MCEAFSLNLLIHSHFFQKRKFGVVLHQEPEIASKTQTFTSFVIDRVNNNAIAIPTLEYTQEQRIICLLGIKAIKLIK